MKKNTSTMLLLFPSCGGVDAKRTGWSFYSNGNNDYPVRKLRFLTPLHRRGINYSNIVHAFLVLIFLPLREKDLRSKRMRGCRYNSNWVSLKTPFKPCHSGLDPESILLLSSSRFKNNVDTGFLRYDKTGFLEKPN